MRCPGKSCDAAIAGDQVACDRCMELHVHPAIQGRLAKLQRCERGSPAHVTLVASIVRLLKEGDW
jgi:hypothetical protein